MNFLLSSVSESMSSPLCIDEEDDDLLSSHPSGGRSMSFSLSADSVETLSTSPGAWELSSVGTAGSGTKGCWWTPLDDVGSGEERSVWPWFWSSFTPRAVDSDMRPTSIRLFAATSSMFESSPFSSWASKKGAIERFAWTCEWLRGRVGSLECQDLIQQTLPLPLRVLTSSDLTKSTASGKKKRIFDTELSSRTRGNQLKSCSKLVDSSKTYLALLH